MMNPSSSGRMPLLIRIIHALPLILASSVVIRCIPQTPHHNTPPTPHPHLPPP